MKQTFTGRIGQMLYQWGTGKSGQVSGEGSHDIDKYNNLHNDNQTSVEGRNAAYVDLVNSYYNLATDFYEWGWGQSFHFAEKLAGENFLQSIARHEYYLPMRLGVEPSDHVLDCGCGIGGPLRNIGQFTGARVTGVTLNQYQVDRGNILCAQAGLDDKCRLVQADFHHMPFDDATFDHCYSIEACCHSPDRADVYGEIFRVLKPGGKFISYEWCLTDSHNPADGEHLLAKKRIEEGDGLPDICYTKDCDKALKKVSDPPPDAPSGRSLVRAAPPRARISALPHAMAAVPSPGRRHWPPTCPFAPVADSDRPAATSALAFLPSAPRRWGLSSSSHAMPPPRPTPVARRGTRSSRLPTSPSSASNSLPSVRRPRPAPVSRTPIPTRPRRRRPRVGASGRGWARVGAGGRE